MFLYGLGWALPAVAGPQLMIDGMRATTEYVSWFGKRFENIEFTQSDEILNGFSYSVT